MNKALNGNLSLEENELIKISELSYKYGDLTALENVSLSIKKGEFIGIIGPNGGGKSTLVKLILNILKPFAGEIKLSKDIVFGYVPQSTSFEKNFPISVIDVVLTGHLPKKIRLRHRFSEHEREHAMTVMESLNIRELAEKKISDLSLGQLQKVLIARALMNHPTVLILDEPTASIDNDSSMEIYSMIKELSQKITVLMITHDVTRDLSFFDKLIYVNKIIHIHTKEGMDAGAESCPIDWLKAGEQIQQIMREKAKTSK